VTRRALTLARLLTLTLLLGCDAKGEPKAGAQPAQTIPLSNVEGRIDHLAIDPGANRLYVAALGNDTVEVIDLQEAKRLTPITGIKKPQGVAVLNTSAQLAGAPAALAANAVRVPTLAVASGDDGKCRLYDIEQRLVGTIDHLDDADNVRYDPRARLLYVGYGDGALAVIDPRTLQKLADIKLDAHPESFQLDPAGDRIYVNVPGASHIAVVDRAKRSVIARWKTEGATANFPMALDAPNHRLYVACRNPAKLLVLDDDSGKVLATPDCAADADDVFYDPTRHRIYVAGGSGQVSVTERADNDTYTNLAPLQTAPGARTALFAPDTGLLYVAVPHRGQQACEIRAYRVRE
jgi:DNA-binding beta-propeller fold protein YncE